MQMFNENSKMRFDLNVFNSLNLLKDEFKMN